MRVEPDLRKAAQDTQHRARNLLRRIDWTPVLPSVITAKAQLETEPETEPETHDQAPGWRSPYLGGP
jgi:hypothetical protein